MKTKYVSYLIFFLLLFHVPSNLSAQSYKPKKVGIKLGYHLGYNIIGNSGKSSHNEIDSYVHTMGERLDGISFAVVYETGLNEFSFFSFELGAVYSGFREKLSLTDENYVSHKYEFDERTIHIQGGILFNLFLTERYFKSYVFGGPLLNYLLSKNTKKSEIINFRINETRNENISYNGSSYLNPNMSLAFGIGFIPFVSKFFTFSFELKYSFDITKRFRIAVQKSNSNIGNKDYFYNNFELTTKFNF